MFRLLKAFQEETLMDEEYIAIAAKMNSELPLDDPHNESVIAEAFLYLDKKCQKMIKDADERMKAKNGPRKLDKTILE